MLKKKLKLLANNLFESNAKNLNSSIINTITRKKKIIKNSILIFYGKNKIIIFFYYYFFLITNNFKFKKNCFLLYRFKNTVIGHNLIPNWPGIYLNQSIFLNCSLWLKKTLYILFFKKKLLAIILRIF